MPAVLGAQHDHVVVAIAVGGVGADGAGGTDGDEFGEGHLEDLAVIIVGELHLGFIVGRFIPIRLLGDEVAGLDPEGQGTVFVHAEEFGGQGPARVEFVVEVGEVVEEAGVEVNAQVGADPGVIVVRSPYAADRLDAQGFVVANFGEVGVFPQVAEDGHGQSAQVAAIPSIHRRPPGAVAGANFGGETVVVL